jgi:hypothetical protein
MKFSGVLFLFEYFLVVLVLKIHKIFCVAIFVIVASHVFGKIPIRHLTCYSLFYMFFFFFFVCDYITNILHLIRQIYEIVLDSS